MADDIAKSMSVKKRKLEQVTTNSMTSESRKFDEVWKSQQAQRSVDRRHCHNYHVSTCGDSDVISMPAGIDILINKRIECYLNNTINLRPLTSHIMPSYTHKLAIISWP